MKHPEKEPEKRKQEKEGSERQRQGRDPSPCRIEDDKRQGKDREARFNKRRSRARRRRNASNDRDPREEQQDNEPTDQADTDGLRLSEEGRSNSQIEQHYLNHPSGSSDRERSRSNARIDWADDSSATDEEDDGIVDAIVTVVAPEAYGEASSNDLTAGTSSDTNSAERLHPKGSKKAPRFTTRRSKIVCCVGVASVCYTLVLAITVAVAMVVRRNGKSDGASTSVNGEQLDELVPPSVAPVTKEASEGTSSGDETDTSEPTTRQVTMAPVAAPTRTPVLEPTASPTSKPNTSDPTSAPTSTPRTTDYSSFFGGSNGNNDSAGEDPTDPPTRSPTVNPTTMPVPGQTLAPVGSPVVESTTGEPTRQPTNAPTAGPTHLPTGSPSTVQVLEPTVLPDPPGWYKTYFGRCSEKDCYPLARPECFAITSSEGIFWIDMLLNFEDAWEFSFESRVEGALVDSGQVASASMFALPETAFGNPQLIKTPLDTSIGNDGFDGEWHLIECLWDPNQDSLVEFKVDGEIALTENLPLPMNYILGSNSAYIGVGGLNENVAFTETALICGRNFRMRVF